MKKVLLSMLLIMALTIVVVGQNQQVVKEKQAQATDLSEIAKFTQTASEFVFDEGKMQLVPNTNISLQAPDYFAFDSVMPGFVHQGTQSSIHVNQVVGTSYLLITPAMDSAYFAKQGMTLISQEVVTMQNGTSGVLFTTEMLINGKSYERLVLMSGDYHYTIWINAVYLKQLATLIKNQILSSILTAKIQK